MDPPIAEIENRELARPGQEFIFSPQSQPIPYFLFFL